MFSPLAVSKKLSFRYRALLEDLLTEFIVSRYGLGLLTN
jgi:hypothetical protein